MKKLNNLKNNNVGAGPVPARKEKGITLIALIITIIVMLILVAVSIQVALNTGLFDSAGKATGDYKAEQEAEQELGSGKVNIAGIEYDSLEEYASTLTKEIPWIYEEDGNGNIVINGIDFSNYPYTIENNIAYIDTGIETLVIPEQLDGKDVVNAWFDEDGIEFAGIKDLRGIKTIILGKNLEVCAFSLSGHNEFSDLVSIIPDKDSALTTLPDESMLGLTELMSFDASETNLRKIGAYAFESCGKLTLDLPNTVTSIGDNAFDGVPVVNFPNGINENLTIPEDKWGASKITIEGVEYVPGN